MNHVLYCCGHSGFDSWATIYPCPKEAFMHKCWEAVKASERSRLARAQIGLRWAKFLVLSEPLYISIIGLCCFSQRVQQIRTQRLTSAFGVINLPHLFHSIPVVVVNFFVHLLLHLRIWLMVLSKVTYIQSKKKMLHGFPGNQTNDFYCFLRTNMKFYNSPIVYIVFTHFGL